MSIEKPMNNKKFSDLTKYPTLFKNSYWGCFEGERNIQIDDDILKNRNEFVEEFNIKTYSGGRRPASRLPQLLAL